MAERKLFGMDSDDLADALESIYKRQKSVEERLEKLAQVAVTVEEIKTHILAMRTSIVQEPSGEAAADVGDGVPPVIKWALAQPWGADLIHGLTDKDMISGLLKLGFDWLKGKATGGAAKTAEAATK